MRNKQGEMLARDWVTSIVLATGVISLLVLMVGSMVNEYDVDNVTSDEFSEKFNTFENNTAIVQDMFNETSGQGGLSTVGVFDVLFTATFSVLSLVFDSVTLVGTQVFGFTEFFGVPSEVGFLFFTILMAVLSIAIVFIIISSVSRRDV